MGTSKKSCVLFNTNFIVKFFPKYNLLNTFGCTVKRITYELRKKKRKMYRELFLAMSQAKV